MIFLTSSPTGPLDGSRIVEGFDEKNRFRENLHRCWKENARCLIIAASPDAAKQNDEMAAFFYHAAERSGFRITCMDLLDRQNLQFSSDELQSYDVILLGGGHVPTQNRFFQEIGLREKLEGYQGILIGISAGSMNSADIVYAQPELEGEAVDPDYPHFLHGLGLTKTQILPHYQMVKDYVLDGKGLFKEITREDSFGNAFLVLTDGSYLLIEDGREEVWGEAYCFSNGDFFQICSEGKTVTWKEKE